MKLEKLLEHETNITLKGDRDLAVTSISINSKTCAPGALFVALPGSRFDGNDYIPEAVAKGAVACVVRRGSALPNALGRVSILEVDNPRAFLASSSALFYGEPTKSLSVLGITGTNGKTTTTYLIESICREAKIPVGVIGTNNIRFNGEVIEKLPNTTPESVEFQRLAEDMLAKGAKVLVSEVSSHALAMNRVDSVHFDIAVFTNLSRDHLDFHGDLETYGNVKKQLFTELLPKSEKASRAAVVNIDDPWGEAIALDVTVPLIRYSLDSQSRAEFRVVRQRFSLSGINATILHPLGTLEISSRLIGKHNLYNIMASVSCAKHMNIRDDAIQKGIAKLTRVPGRLERVDTTKGTKVYIDYAHTPDALENVLSTLKALNPERIITVFGCGGNRDKGKRTGMGSVASKYSTIIVLTNDNPRDEDPRAIIEAIERGIDSLKRVSKDEFQTKKTTNNFYTIIPDRREAISFALSQSTKDDVVLIAGKGHENYQIIGSKTIHFDDYEVAKEILNV